MKDDGLIFPSHTLKNHGDRLRSDNKTIRKIVFCLCGARQKTLPVSSFCAHSPYYTLFIRLCSSNLYFDRDVRQKKLLMLNIRHFQTTIGAVPACLDAFIHTADFFAIRRACLADFGADFAQAMLKMRATELKIG